MNDSSINANSNAEEPWELDDIGEENLKVKPFSIKNKFESYDNVPLDSPKLEISDNKDGSSDENEEDNYDNYFSKQKRTSDTEPQSSKSVRFDENIEKVNVLTPKDSLEGSIASSTPSDTDEDTDNEEIPSNFNTITDRISDFMDEDQMNQQKMNNNKIDQVVKRNVIHQEEKHLSTTESEDLPPPLPPLPPLNKKTSKNFVLFYTISIINCFYTLAVSTDNIPLKSAAASSSPSPQIVIDLKHRNLSRSDPEIGSAASRTNESKLLSNNDAPVIQAFNSGIVIILISVNI